MESRIPTRQGAPRTVSIGKSRSVSVESFYKSELFSSALQRGELDEILSQVVECYREIFGSEPWNEYLKCSDKQCNSKMGVGAVLQANDIRLQSNLSLAQIEAAGLVNLDSCMCPRCGRKLELFYPFSVTRKKIMTEYKKNITGVLLWDQYDRLSGFTWAWMTNYQELWVDKFEAAYGDKLLYADYEQLVHQAGRDPLSHVFYLAEWGLADNIRGTGSAMVLFDELQKVGLARLSEWVDKTDIVTYSADGSKAHHVLAGLNPQYLYDDGITNIAYQPAAVLLSLFDKVVGERLRRSAAGTKPPESVV